MTDQHPAPGWYEDPSGDATIVRWWDGGAWTSHTAPRPASGPAPVVTGRPALAAGAPIYTPFIWLTVFLPLLSTVALFFYRPAPLALSSTAPLRTPGSALAEVFTPGYFIVLGTGLVVYALCVIFSALDQRALRALGVVRPFGWGWSFLSPIIYVIGRSVIVHQVARPRGLATIWVLIGVVVVSFGAAITWNLLLVAQLTPGLSTLSSAV